MSSSSSDIEFLPASTITIKKSPSKIKTTSTTTIIPLASTSNSNSTRSSVDLPNRPKPRRIVKRIGVNLSNNSIKEDLILDGTTTEDKEGKNSQGSSNNSSNTLKVSDSSNSNNVKKEGGSKGKGKSKQNEIIILDDDEEEELDNFFSKAKPTGPPKRRFGANKQQKQPILPSSSSPSSASSRSPSPNSVNQLRTKKNIKLPDWTHIQSNAMKKVLAKGSKPNRAKRLMSVSSEGSDDDTKGGGKAGGGKKDTKGKGKGKGKLQVVELSDDSDDSLLFEDNEDFSKAGNRSQGGGRNKNKKGKYTDERERSRSLTPPAPLAAFAMAQSMQVLRDNLGPERTAPLPNSSPFKLRSTAGSSPFGSDRIASSQKFGSDDNDVDDDDEDEEDDSNKVTINVITIFDPTRIDPSPRAVVAYQTPRPYRVSPDSNFSKLFKSISTILAVKDRSTLVMTYQSRKVYEFGTPSTLKIHSEATFKCYTKEIWLASENLRLNPVITSDVIVGVAVAVASTSNSLERERETSVLPSNVPTMNSNPEEESEATTTSIDLLKITIRGSSTQSFSLAVKKTMLVSQLLKQYCKKFEILDLDRINKMWLEFDGEKLEGSKMLKDFDEIEDEETVDVREGK